MAVMSSAINALATFYPESLDPFDPPETVELATVLILAKTRTITSYLHRTSRGGEPLLYPDYSRGYIEDFLRMTFAVPYQQYDVDPPTVVRALDKLLILHADHEQNCSTSTVRIVGSSHANLYASVAAGDQRPVRPAARRGRTRPCCGCSRRSRRTAATPPTSCAA